MIAARCWWVLHGRTLSLVDGCRLLAVLHRLAGAAPGRWRLLIDGVEYPPPAPGLNAGMLEAQRLLGARRAPRG